MREIIRYLPILLKVLGFIFIYWVAKRSLKYRDIKDTIFDTGMLIVYTIIIVS